MLGAPTSKQIAQAGPPDDGFLLTPEVVHGGVDPSALAQGLGRAASEAGVRPEIPEFDPGTQKPDLFDPKGIKIPRGMQIGSMLTNLGAALGGLSGNAQIAQTLQSLARQKAGQIASFRKEATDKEMAMQEAMMRAGEARTGREFRTSERKAGQLFQEQERKGRQGFTKEMSEQRRADELKKIERSEGYRTGEREATEKSRKDAATLATSRRREEQETAILARAKEEEAAALRRGDAATAKYYRDLILMHEREELMRRRPPKQTASGLDYNPGQAISDVFEEPPKRK